LLVIAPAAARAAPSIRAAKLVVQDRMPVQRPDFPKPSDPNMLFYIQRSMNANTVVYAANFRADGTLDPRKPVEAFWRRFNTTGERKALGFMEDRLAYGVRAKRIGDGEFEIRLVAYPERTMVVRQAGRDAVTVEMRIGAHVVRPVYAYVEVDEGGLIPSVTGLKFFGEDVSNGKAVIETSTVSGGQIQ
jgi:hypothetical protein